MEERLSRVDMLQRLDGEYQHINNTFSRLSPQQWLTPNVVGTWSPKDLLAHLVFWTRFPAQELAAAMNGKHFPHPDGTGDEINARAVAAFKDSTLDAVRTAFDESYAGLVTLVRSLPDTAFEAGSQFEQQLDDTVHGALANNTYEHWPIHNAQIRAWLEG